VELDHHAAAVAVFGSARSGTTLREPAFTHRPSWSVDILIELDGGPLAIEYDGAYWHADKGELDLAKTLDLLAAGHRVARLREEPLPSLAVQHQNYFEVRVYSQMPRPAAVISEVESWALAREGAE
jgi:hypothetical protein